MPYIFGKLWHLAIIWDIRKAFQCILQGVRFLLANHTRLSPTSDNDSYIDLRLLYCFLLWLLSFSRKAHSTLYWLRKGASFYLCCSYWAYCFLLLCCYCCYNDRNNKMKTFIIFKGSSLNIVLVAKTGDQVQPLHYWIGRNQNRQPTSLNTFLPYDKIHISICIIQCDNFLP